MAFERKWAAVAPVSFTQDGSTLGVVTLADTAGFYVKQTVFLSSSSQTPTAFQIKWVLSDTQLVVGKIDSKVGRNFGSDISAFTLASTATIGAGEQDKNNIPDKDHYAAIYESDPIVADRVILVDNAGEHFTDKNPLPVAFAGSVNIGDVTVQGPNGNTLKPNQDGSINVVLDGGSSTTVLKNLYGQASAVPAQGSATILTYTVPPGVSVNLQKISVSGENVAKFDVILNNQTIDTQRTSWTNLNTIFDFRSDQSYGGYPLSPSDKIQVLVLNSSSSNSVASFNARLQAAQFTTS